MTIGHAYAKAPPRVRDGADVSSAEAFDFVSQILGELGVRE